MNEEKHWGTVINNETWTVSVSGPMSQKLGANKRDWIEEEAKRLYPESMNGPNPSHHAGTTFRGASEEVQVAIDYDFSEMTVHVGDPSS